MSATTSAGDLIVMCTVCGQYYYPRWGHACGAVMRPLISYTWRTDYNAENARLAELAAQNAADMIKARRVARYWYRRATEGEADSKRYLERIDELIRYCNELYSQVNEADHRKDEDAAYRQFLNDLLKEERAKIAKLRDWIRRADMLIKANREIMDAEHAKRLEVEAALDEMDRSYAELEDNVAMLSVELQAARMQRDMYREQYIRLATGGKL